MVEDSFCNNPQLSFVPIRALLKKCQTVLEIQDRNVRWSKPVEPFANQRDYHGIKYEESQDREKTEETLGIVPLIACLFIWSAPLTSIDGWGIRLPLPTFEWTEASLLYISFFAWSRQMSFILNIVVRRTFKVIVTLKACCFIWLVSPTSIVRLCQK